MKQVLIKEKALKSINNNHPWIFSGALEKVDNEIENGELCKIFFKNKFLGIGYYNSSSSIAIRILTRKDENIDKEFFLKRFKILKVEKEKFLNNTDAYRLCFGETDNIPGLIVDIYANIVVLQIHTLGIEKLKELIIEALKELYKPIAIYEKSDLPVRKKEGLQPKKAKLLYGKDKSNVEIKENGFKFIVDIKEGQKTGFFLDQRDNRNAVLKYTLGKKVLNCFCYTGAFSVYAAKNASKVTSVDISKKAIELAKQNFLINGFPLEKHSFIVQDVFNFFKNVKKNDYNLIILDPPSFAKNKNQVKNAIKAYITLNTIALDKLNDFDILVTSSCTTHIDENTFLKILHKCSVNTNCQLKVLFSSVQPHDHSYNLSYPEGRYLKFFILQKWPLL